MWTIGSHREVAQVFPRWIGRQEEPLMVASSGGTDPPESLAAESYLLYMSHDFRVSTYNDKNQDFLVDSTNGAYTSKGSVHHSDTCTSVQHFQQLLAVRDASCCIDDRGLIQWLR